MTVVKEALSFWLAGLIRTPMAPFLLASDAANENARLGVNIKSKRRASSDAAQKNKEKEAIITYY